MCLLSRVSVCPDDASHDENRRRKELRRKCRAGQLNVLLAYTYRNKQKRQHERAHHQHRRYPRTCTALLLPPGTLPAQPWGVLLPWAEPPSHDVLEPDGTPPPSCGNPLIVGGAPGATAAPIPMLFITPPPMLRLPPVPAADVVGTIAVELAPPAYNAPRLAIRLCALSAVVGGPAEVPAGGWG